MVQNIFSGSENWEIKSNKVTTSVLMCPNNIEHVQNGPLQRDGESCGLCMIMVSK